MSAHCQSELCSIFQALARPGAAPGSDRAIRWVLASGSGALSLRPPADAAAYAAWTR